MSVRIMQEDGQAFEDRYLGMLNRFRDAETGVPSSDVFAALILEVNQDRRLEGLLQGRIHVVGEVDEQNRLEGLKFKEVS